MEDGALGVAQGLAGLQVHEWRLAAGRVHRGHEGFELDRALRRARRRDALRRQRGEAGHGERVLGVDHAGRPMMVRQRRMTGGVSEPLDFTPLDAVREGSGHTLRAGADSRRSAPTPSGRARCARRGPDAQESDKGGGAIGIEAARHGHRSSEIEDVRADVAEIRGGGPPGSVPALRPKRFRLICSIDGCSSRTIPACPAGTRCRTSPVSVP